MLSILLQQGFIYSMEAVSLAAEESASIVNNNYDTALHKAAEGNGNKRIIELLITNGADVRAVNKKGYTPLHCAATFSDTKVVRELIANDSDVNAITNDGNTPLHLASSQGKDRVVELLIRRGAKV